MSCMSNIKTPPEVLGIPLPWNFLPSKDDDKFVFHNWVASDCLGDESCLLDLYLLLPGGQLGLLESARIVLICMTFFCGGSLATASQSLIWWTGPLTMNSMQWPSLTSYSKCLFQVKQSFV
ncbi:unnamed protein product [Prunus armeniaca]